MRMLVPTAVCAVPRGATQKRQPAEA
jgi:hypothetical protein